MQWYKTGTVSVVNGSPVVTGAGTLWLLQVNPGDILTLDASTLSEVLTVDSNVQITLAKPYSGATASAQPYAILRNFTSTTNATLAAKIAELLNDWQNRENEIADWQGGTATGGPTSNGLYPLTDAQGNVFPTKSIARIELDALSAAVNGTWVANAATSEANALASKNAAATSEANALVSKNSATASATSATNSATAADASATSSASSATSAATSASTATTKYTSFDTRYLGAKSSAPALDNLGAALVTGALYLDTTLNAMRSWNGSAWASLPASSAGSVTNAPAGSISATTVQGALNELDSEKETATNKNASGGYAGLTLFAHNCRNVANTFTSLLTNTATAVRTWTMPDKSGTVALLDDRGMVLLGSAVAANSATIDFTGLDTTAYSSFILTCDKVVPAINGATLGLRGLISGVPVQGATDYSSENVRFTAASAGAYDGTYDSAIWISGIVEQLGTAVNRSYSVDVRISFEDRMSVTYHGRGLMASSSYVTCIGGGGNYSATGFNGLRILLHNGNIASGKFKLYGMRA